VAAAVAAALLLAIVALLGLSSGAREAVADLLGLTGVSFFTAPEGSTPKPPAAGGEGAATTTDLASHFPIGRRRVVQTCGSDALERWVYATRANLEEGPPL